MIVRLNQFDVTQTRSVAGWDRHEPVSAGVGGDSAWPADTLAFEILILEQDEQDHPLEKSFRQSQLRRLIVETSAALLEENQKILVRLDGPLQAGGLTAAFSHLTSPDGQGRFAFSEARKFATEPAQVMGSVRLCLSPDRLAALCADQAIGLEHEVRLRIYGIVEEGVDPLLDVDGADDERWPELLDQTGFMISTVRGLESIHLLTRHYTPAEVRHRLLHRLTSRLPPAQTAL